MSAYLCSSQTLSVIAKSVKYYSNKDHTGEYLLNSYHGHNFLDPNNSLFECRFFTLLLTINQLSLHERYGDSEEGCEGIAEETDFYKLINSLIKTYALKALGEVKHWGIDSYKELTDNDRVIPEGAIPLFINH